MFRLSSLSFSGSISLLELELVCCVIWRNDWFLTPRENRWWIKTFIFQLFLYDIACCWLGVIEAWNFIQCCARLCLGESQLIHRTRNWILLQFLKNRLFSIVISDTRVTSILSVSPTFNSPPFREARIKKFIISEKIKTFFESRK